MNESNFFSLDRLMEFGLSMAFARQMVQVMNQSMQQMYVPGSPFNMQPVAPTTLYVALDGQPVGPLSESEFSRLVTERRVNPETLVWTPGMLSWKPMKEVPDALKIVALTPPPLNTPPCP